MPTVEAFQRHELTLLRMEDILNTGSGSKPSGLESAGLEFNGQGRWDYIVVRDLTFKKFTSYCQGGHVGRALPQDVGLLPTSHDGQEENP